MRVLESERVVLKPVEETDLDYLRELRWDKDITKYLLHDSISRADQLNWFKGIKKEDLVLSIFVKEANGLRIVGAAAVDTINHRHRRATWKLRIESSVQGKGIAHEAIVMVLDYAFNTMNLNRIASEAFVENAAIRKLATKLGFVEEGIFRQYHFHEGQYRDCVLLACIRDDFNRLQQSKSQKHPS